LEIASNTSELLRKPTCSVFWAKYGSEGRWGGYERAETLPQSKIGNGEIIYLKRSTSGWAEIRFEN